VLRDDVTAADEALSPALGYRRRLDRAHPPLAERGLVQVEAEELRLLLWPRHHQGAFSEAVHREEARRAESRWGECGRKLVEAMRPYRLSPVEGGLPAGKV
jgi:hypothetical protein